MSKQLDALIAALKLRYECTLPNAPPDWWERDARVVLHELERAGFSVVSDQAVDGAYDAGAKFAEECLDANNRELLHATLKTRRGYPSATDDAPRTSGLGET